MTKPDSQYKERLEQIADKHLTPDAGQVVDVLLRSHIMKRIFKWVQGPEVLEMGAGEIMWTEELIQLLGHSSIVDGSAKLIQNAKDNYGDKVTCYESFFEEFVPPDGKRFNTVVATHVMEHVHDPVVVMRQAHKWLAPQGRMIVVVPNATSLHRKIGVKMGVLKTIYDFSERDVAVGHQRVYDLPKLRSDAESAGFRIVHEQGFLIKTVSVAQMKDYSKELIQALFDIADDLPPEMSADIGLILEAK